MGARRRALTINTDKQRGSEVAAADGVNGGLTEGVGGQPLSPAARLFHQPHFNCTIIAVMGLGKAIDVDAIKAGLEASIVRHPRFSSILVSDEPGSEKSRWVPTKVVVDNHIVVPDINPSQTATTTTSADQLVEDYVSSLTTTPLPHSQPLWDLHLINMRTSEAEAIAVLRIHHSLGDGVSLMSLLLACTRKTSQADSLPSLPGSRRQNSADSNGSSIVWGLLLWLWAMLVLTWNTIVDVVNFTATSAFLNDTETPIKGVEGVEFHQKRIVHRTLSLDDIKTVKSAVGCTINDVFIGVTSAGLSRYLNGRYDKNADGEKKECKLPTNIRLRTTVLVNIRPTPGIHALAEMMEGGKGTRWGNWLGYMVLKFPIGMYKDPLDYVRKGMKIAERKKNSLEAIFTYTSGSLIVKLLGIKAAAALCYRVLRHTTISFSNIVGPVEEVAFYDHPLTYIAPSVCGHPQAVTLHFQSYMNKVKAVLAVDELTVPDPHQLLDDVIESLKLIKNAVVTRLP